MSLLPNTSAVGVSIDDYKEMAERVMRASDQSKDAEIKCLQAQSDKRVLEVQAKADRDVAAAKEERMQAEIEHGKRLLEETKKRHTAEKMALEAQCEQHATQKRPSSKGRLKRTVDSVSGPQRYSNDKFASASLDKMKKKELQDMATECHIPITKPDGSHITAPELRKKLYSFQTSPKSNDDDATTAEIEALD